MMEQKRFKVQIMNFTIGKRISAVFCILFISFQKNESALFCWLWAVLFNKIQLKLCNSHTHLCTCSICFFTFRFSSFLHNNFFFCSFCFVQIFSLIPFNFTVFIVRLANTLCFTSWLVAASFLLKSVADDNLRNFHCRNN